MNLTEAQEHYGVREWGPRAPMAVRLFRDVVEVEPSGCWQWMGSLSRGGYGHLRSAGRSVYTHRTAYELLVGPIPAGLQLDHLCRNRGCCNPAHLEPVTPRTNVLRGMGPGALNARKTACLRGHTFTPENTIQQATGRACRACVQAAQRRRYERAKTS